MTSFCINVKVKIFLGYLYKIIKILYEITSYIHTSIKSNLFYLKKLAVYCCKLFGPNSIRHCKLANIKQWLTSTGYRPCRILYFASAYNNSIIFWSLKFLICLMYKMYLIKLEYIYLIFSSSFLGKNTFLWKLKIGSLNITFLVWMQYFSSSAGHFW